MATTQDPIEQVLDKLGEFGLPVGEIGEKAKGLISQVGAMNPDDMIEQVGAIDFSKIDVTEMIGELKDKVDSLDPALRVPVMIAAGFVGARVLRWIIK